MYCHVFFGSQCSDTVTKTLQGHFTQLIHCHVEHQPIADCVVVDILCIGTATEKSEKLSRCRRKKGLRQLFSANGKDASNL